MPQGRRVPRERARTPTKAHTRAFKHKSGAENARDTARARGRHAGPVRRAGGRKPFRVNFGPANSRGPRKSR